MNLDGYIRVSRVNQRSGDSFISVDIQKERIAAWARTNGHKIVTWHEDLDEPGSKLERPHLKEMMTRVRARKTDGVAVMRLDRFGRSVHHTAKLYEEIREAGGALISISEGIDTSEGFMAEFLMNLFTSLAQLELARITEGWNAARANAVARGVHIAGAVPFGYRKDQHTKLLTPDPATGPLVHDLFLKRAANTSWAGLAHYLESRQVETPQGHRHWGVNSIKAIIGNRVYLGEARAGGDLVNEGAHPPLVSAREFSRANQTRGVAPRRTGKSSGLLSGVIRCAGCRYAMKPSATRGQLAYRCKTRARGAASQCESCASIGAGVVEPYVLDFVLAQLSGVTERALKADDDISDAEGLVAETTRHLVAYRDDTKLSEALGGRDAALFIDGLKTRLEALTRAQETLERTIQYANAASIPNLNQNWDDKPFEERREIVKALLDSVFVWRKENSRIRVEERVVIYAKGEGPTDLPVKGRRYQATPLPWPDPAK